MYSILTKKEIDKFCESLFPAKRNLFLSSKALVFKLLLEGITRGYYPRGITLGVLP
jgi:hypothetical protein